MESKWNTLASNILKAELMRRGITYKQLHERLLSIGVSDSFNSLKIKLFRGTFQFAFFLQCAAAIGMKELQLDELAGN